MYVDNFGDRQKYQGNFGLALVSSDEIRWWSVVSGASAGRETGVGRFGGVVYSRNSDLGRRMRVHGGIVRL
jgi:hypothetical protein